MSAAYRYGPAALAEAPERTAETLYVIGGLYGNRPALDAVEALAAAEPGPVTLCFNGDFHWFDVDDATFGEINRRVLRHDAILGNVEAELLADDEEAGCGCAYPDTVDAGVVERSNRIHARLKATARRHPEALAGLGGLPMVARRYRIGAARVGVVHGDAEALAGWRFAVEALDDPAQRVWIEEAFRQARVDLSLARRRQGHRAPRGLRRVSVGNGQWRPGLTVASPLAGQWARHLRTPGTTRFAC